MSHFYDDYHVGYRHETYARTITESDHSLFCALVGYHVPLFIDEEYARKTQFGGRICPSALVMSISTAMTESLFRDSILASLGIENGKFLLPVRIGDTIHTEVEVIAMRPSAKADRGVVTFRDRVLNQHGESVFEIDKIVLIRRQPAAARS
ncbi:Bifunctional protein PaaZ [Pigmentiphaga humi]|uniref:Bifunctional protein PaaZ n=1 Tax=Pigmentiphaga humi TaxID=2478468 RepID=A0A3P4B5C7_9BURK|nr:MaoC family dehydratase [Pigmentiphaga humi]VCU70868.1 Bifunctional protein PaaZ [Pigmentiphaga humi]